MVLRQNLGDQQPEHAAAEDDDECDQAMLAADDLRHEIDLRVKRGKNRTIAPADIARRGGSSRRPRRLRIVRAIPNRKKLLPNGPLATLLLSKYKYEI
jgi:hypothetical protein